MRLVRRWQALVEQKGELPLEEDTAIATELSDAQRDSLSDVAEEAGLPGELRDLQWNLFTLQLYAALTPDQRQALWRGSSVLVAQMTPPERELFEQGLEMVQNSGAVWSPEEMAAARLSMTSQPMLRIVTTRGAASTERLEPQPPGEAGGATGSAETSASSPGARAPAASEKRYPVLRVSFQYQIGAGAPAVWQSTVAMPETR